MSASGGFEQPAQKQVLQQAARSRSGGNRGATRGTGRAPAPASLVEETHIKNAPWSHRLRLILAFGAIYVLWGTSYLAIRVALNGIPPALMSGARFVLAGLMLLGIGAAGGGGFRPPRETLFTLAGIGGLLVAGNWGVVWSEQYVASGVAALIFATAPLCIAALSAAVSSAERLTARAGAGLALGLAGVAVLVWPKVSRGPVGDLRGEGALALAVLVWSVASVWAKHAALPLPPFVAAGWQLLAGGALFVLLAILLGEPARFRWEGPSVLAFCYLTVSGSCLGYGSYLWLLHHVPAARAATFAYVNPVVAVLLGWMLLAEPLGLFVILGTLVIVPAVFLTIASRKAPGE